MIKLIIQLIFLDEYRPFLSAHSSASLAVVAISAAYLPDEVREAGLSLSLPLTAGGRLFVPSVMYPFHSLNC